MTGLPQIRVAQLFISPGHNFFGHHGRPPGEQPLVECTEIRCVAGRGIEGDRFFDFRANYKGQITFFASEVFADLCWRLGASGMSPGMARRNVITAGVDLISLVGVEFEIQGLRFVGTEECSPCHWMNEAIGPGAEAALRGRGGLRAQILTDGWLRLDNSGPALSTA
jgi:MOSC domain-containing protein YiiM